MDNLFAAIDSNNLERVKEAIWRHARVNEPNRSGETPLKLAVTYGNIEIIKYLLENGADPNQRTGVGDYPIHGADSPEIVRLLWKYGADINSIDDRGLSLYESIRTGVEHEDLDENIKNNIIKTIKSLNALVNFQRIARTARRTAHTRQALLEKIPGRPLYSDVARLIAQMSLNTSFGNRRRVRIKSEINYLLNRFYG